MNLYLPRQVTFPAIPATTQTLRVLGKHHDPRHPEQGDILLYEAANAAAFFVAVWSSIGLPDTLNRQAGDVKVQRPRLGPSRD